MLLPYQKALAEHGIKDLRFWECILFLATQRLLILATNRLTSALPVSFHPPISPYKQHSYHLTNRSQKKQFLHTRYLKCFIALSMKNVPRSMKNVSGSLRNMEKKLRRKEFIIIKKGLSHYLLKTSDIAYIFMENEITYIIDKNGTIYICFQNLNALEEQLDHCFFRANRQYIINVDFIKSFRVYERSKIVVEMTVNEQNTPIHISQATAPKFKEWIANF